MANYKKIATHTVTGSTAADITFSSIPATYEHLLLLSSGKGVSGLDWAMVKLNGTGSYDARYAYSDGTATATDLQASQANPLFQVMSDPNQLNTNVFTSGEVYIFNYAHTSGEKIIMSTSGEANDTNTQNARIAQWDIASDITGAITSIEIKAQAGNLNIDTIYTLYGLEG